MRHFKALKTLLKQMRVESEMDLADSISHDDWGQIANWRSILRLVKKAQKLLEDEAKSAKKVRKQT